MIYDTERQMSGSSYIENLKHMQWESVHIITKKRGTCCREQAIWRQFGKLCKEIEDKLSLFAKIDAGSFINKMCHFCKTSPFLFFVMTCWEVAIIHCKIQPNLKVQHIIWTGNWVVIHFAAFCFTKPNAETWPY